jgi:hypothetical protein
MIGIDQTTSSIRPENAQVWQVARALVRRSEPPRESQRGDDRRHDDREHDRHRVDEDQALGATDRPARVKQGRLAAGEHQDADCAEATRTNGRSITPVRRVGGRLAQRSS